MNVAWRTVPLAPREGSVPAAAVVVADNSGLRVEPDKVSGAPLAGHEEHKLGLCGTNGKPIIPHNARVRLAAPVTNDGEAILRRGFSFTDGIDPTTGELDAGLFFIAYQKDPHRQFVAIQTRIGASDALNDYIVHAGGGLFAVPPGIRPGGGVAEGLFA